MLLHVALLAAQCLHAAALPYGHAAYVYPQRGQQNTAQWAADLAAFNKNTSISGATIGTVFTYGGDVEYLNLYPYRAGQNVFFAPDNMAAATAYARVPSVGAVVAILDGRMDGVEICTEYDHFPFDGDRNVYPDLSKVTPQQAAELANVTAGLFCQSADIEGIQVDLEPASAPYRDNLLVFLRALAAALRSGACVTARFPAGRSVSMFTFAEAVDAAMVDALGANGYLVISGYDLYSASTDFRFNTPAAFAAKLQREVAALAALARQFPAAHYSLALPIAASCHEYERYTPGQYCGPQCTPYSNPAAMADYATAAFGVLRDNAPLFRLYPGRSAFLGFSFWVWTGEMSYPPMGDFHNTFGPTVPSPTALQIVKQNLPLFDAVH